MASANTMRAFGIEEYGSADNVKELTLPKPSSPAGHDIVVKVHAVSLNPVDCKKRSGAVMGDGPVPAVLGYDAAGVVAEVGPDCSLFKPGDEVFYAGAIQRPGTNSEYHVVDERIVGRKPKNLSFSEAAAIPLVYLTAAEALFENARLTPENAKGKTILIVAGAGGVGSVASQIAKNYLGMRVISTASRPESEAYCKAHGADYVISHSNADGFKAELAKHAELADLVSGGPATGVDVAYACCELDTCYDQLTDVVKTGGTILSISFKDPSTINVAKLFMKRLTLSFEAMFARPLFYPADIAKQHEHLNQAAAMLEDGRLKSTMSSDVELTAANLAQAHKNQDAGRVIGKQVLHF